MEVVTAAEARFAFSRGIMHLELTISIGLSVSKCRARSRGAMLNNYRFPLAWTGWMRKINVTAVEFRGPVKNSRAKKKKEGIRTLGFPFNVFRDSVA